MRCLGAHKERGAGLERTGISIINMYVGVADCANTYFAARLVYILLSAFSSLQYILTIQYNSCTMYSMKQMYIPGKRTEAKRPRRCHHGQPEPR